MVAARPVALVGVAKIVVEAAALDHTLAAEVSARLTGRAVGVPELLVTVPLSLALASKPEF